jgi:hypothetical protein
MSKKDKLMGRKEGDKWFSVMAPVKAARRDKDTGKIHLATEGQPDTIYLDIRAGLVWPHQTQPGYWLIFGQRDEQNAFGKHPLVLLGEGKSRDLGKLFDSMTDLAVRLKCENVYVNMSEENDCFREAFSRYCDEGNIRRVFMGLAPYVENFDYGIGLIRQGLKDKALEIDQDSIIARQLREIPESVLEENQRDEYYSLHALRFVLASFVKYSWRAPMGDIDYGDWYKYPGFYRGINI